MSLRGPLPDVVESVVLGPEDRLVLVFKALDQEQFNQIKDTLAKRGFDDRVLIVAGVEGFVVLRGGAS